MIDYHNNEWGKPTKDSRYIFEQLCLEGMQAGLSWETVLKKREEYRNCFYNFDPLKIASMTDQELIERTEKYAVIKYLLKQKAIRTNAIALIELEKTENFADFIWSFTNNKVIDNRVQQDTQILAKNDLSTEMSKELQKRGFKFVGPTTCYAFMQAIGMINDHLITCQYNPNNRSKNENDSIKQ
jgi:DNA-3-methyladenine glycosylase I